MENKGTCLSEHGRNVPLLSFAFLQILEANAAYQLTGYFIDPAPLQATSHLLHIEITSVAIRAKPFFARSKQCGALAVAPPTSEKCIAFNMVRWFLIGSKRNFVGPSRCF